MLSVTPPMFSYYDAYHPDGPGWYTEILRIRAEREEAGHDMHRGRADRGSRAAVDQRRVDRVVVAE